MTIFARLEDGIEPEEFFGELLPEIHEEQGGHERFFDYCEVPVVVSFVILTDSDDLGGGRRWSVRFQEGDLDIEEGELDDDPLFTFACHHRDWLVLSPRLHEALEELEDWSDDHVADPVTEDELNMLRRFDGKVTFEISGYEAEDGRRDMHFTIVIGGYDTDSPRHARVLMSADDAEAIGRSELPPGRAFADGKLRLKGDVALAMQLGATLKRIF